MKSTKVIWRIFRFFFCKLSMESIFASLAYILENMHPTIITILSAALFEAADRYLVRNGEAADLWGYAALIIIYFVLYNILRTFSSVCINAGIYEKAMHWLNNDIVAAASRFPLIQYENDEMLTCKRRAMECVKNDRIPGIFMLLIVLITSIAGIFSLLVTLGIYHPLLPIIAVASVLQFIFSNWVLEKESYRLETSMVQRRRKRDYIWSLFTNLESVREMHVMGFAGYLADQWKSERDEVNEKQWRLDRKRSRYYMLCDAVRTIGYLTGVIFCVLLLQKSMISVGVFGACLVAFASVQNVVGNFFGSIGKLPGFVRLAADYYSYIDRSIQKKETLQELQGSIRTIELKNICFKYPNSEKEAVKAASLKIHQGEVVSLVGVNGSGKTTLIKLLLGIYVPEQGTVFYNDMDLKTLNKESLYQHTGLLTQDFALYHLSLDENIALTDIDHVYEKARVREVLKKVHMDAILDGEENDGKILGRDFGGAEFSEGQKQRLALGRVLFADRELVILDEPTSALDPIQENEILEEFLKISKGRTTIIISHRVGLCRFVDRIAVMKEGSIVECGNHDQLMAKKGEYRNLYCVQSKWYADNGSL